MTTGFNGDISTIQTIAPGENLSSLSSRIFNGDWSRFPELLELNPSLDVFSDLTSGTQINVPNADQVFNFATNELDSITKGITQLEGVPILSGYAPKALDLVGKVNGSLGRAESIYKTIQTGARDYGKQGSVKLVQWLLSGK